MNSPLGAPPAVGDYDLSTLLARADPVGGTQILQSGMTVPLKAVSGKTR